MSPWEWTWFVVMPVLGILGYYVGLGLAPDAFSRIFFSEQGLIEIGTAALYGVAACVAVALVFKTRGVVPKHYRVLYFLFALAALFIALEEISYGQHLFSWETPRWFAEHNFNRETNLHNLFQSKPSGIFASVAHVVFPMGCIVLPLLVMRSRGEYKPDHWAYYILPRGELITAVALASLLRLLRKLPPSVLTGEMWDSEFMEFYWATAALMYVVIMWRRLISSGWKAHRQLRPSSVVISPRDLRRG